MKITIITPVFNSIATIEGCLKSFRSQTCLQVEHIIIDGGSKDGTVEFLKQQSYENLVLISESDNGIYDAINKGISIATGDIIGILHSDDFYPNKKVLESVLDVFDNLKIDALYGDLEYVSKFDSSKVVRLWRAGVFNPSLLRVGWMPPHPTLFLRKDVFEKYGTYNQELKISADFEATLRYFSAPDLTFHYLPKVLMRMRTGGVSNKSIGNIIRKVSEDYCALRLNNFGFFQSIYAILNKNISKISQLSLF